MRDKNNGELPQAVVVSIIGGIMSGKKTTSKDSGLGKWVLIGIGALFVGSIIWSFIAETLMPLLAAGDSGAVLRSIVGFPIILAGTAFIVYGGYIFVRDTFSAMRDPEMVSNVAQIRERTAPAQNVRAARWQNFWMLVRSWKAGTWRMLLGFGLIAVGGWLINL